MPALKRIAKEVVEEGTGRLGQQVGTISKPDWQPRTILDHFRKAQAAVRKARQERYASLRRKGASPKQIEQKGWMYQVPPKKLKLPSKKLGRWIDRGKAESGYKGMAKAAYVLYLRHLKTAGIGPAALRGGYGGTQYGLGTDLPPGGRVTAGELRLAIEESRKKGKGRLRALRRRKK
jgi:hypothetical protein